ncbi:MarR family winged helix-turn-helix transcriptional regulator [Microbacterium indicum]|uniref:MarR family winged helix-turn-helix transcriptional regulator n=1 Tax=Microbacterium indicum TaxID=358100 RepID=UPI000686377B|nr:MarR family transcriptional regulator [Microbacterium indicum]
MTTSPASATVVDGRTTLAQRWCSLQVAHDRIAAHVEKRLQPAHGISVREFSMLEVLGRQHDGDGGHLQMKELAEAVALSQSATTRLVARMEDRGLLTRYICTTDRRGIYTDVTDAGRELLEAARPLNDAALGEALAELGEDPLFADLVGVLRG